ncbi:MAG: glycosyltransferase, partial [Chitinophagales bacterium]
LIHVHVPMKAGRVARWIKNKWNVPYIISEQASTYEEAAPDFFGKRSLYYQSSVKKIFENADAATNVSKKMGERIKKLLKIKKEILTVPNVADESLFRYVLYRPQPFCFIHVSAMNDQKNIKGILSVFKKLCAIRIDWKLKLVGPYNQALKAFVSLQGLDRSVQFTGEVSYNEVAKHMQLSSALVMFSRHENFPCVVVEALCCGLPVVASEAGGISEAVNKSNGLLVPAEDENALLLALQKMMDNYNSYNREKISKDAHDHFSMKVAGEKFCSLYDQIIAGS